jgi:hypothetical protein
MDDDFSRCQDPSCQKTGSLFGTGMADFKKVIVASMEVPPGETTLRQEMTMPQSDSLTLYKEHRYFC